jgi:hypothetical protein
VKHPQNVDRIAALRSADSGLLPAIWYRAAADEMLSQSWGFSLPSKFTEKSDPEHHSY